MSFYEIQTPGWLYYLFSTQTQYLMEKAVVTSTETTFVTTSRLTCGKGRNGTTVIISYEIA